MWTLSHVAHWCPLIKKGPGLLRAHSKSIGTGLTGTAPSPMWAQLLQKVVSAVPIHTLCPGS